MGSQPHSPFGLKLQLETTSNETIVHCTGKITAENSELFQRQIRDLIPESRAQVAAITRRRDPRRTFRRHEWRRDCEQHPMHGSMRTLGLR